MRDSQQEIEQLQIRLKEVEEEYENFSYIVSHDLKACLRSIDGFSNLIAEKHADDFDDETLGHFNRISNNAKHAKDILSVLLKFAHTSKGKQSFTLCHCNEIFEQVKEMLSPLIEKSNAKITYPDLPNVMGNKDHLTTIFFNLLQNALIYHKDNSPVEIEISCDEKPDQWQFSIKDNGIGIKENMTKTIFEPLKRGVSNKKYPDGLGMGLAFCQKILKYHDGKIWLESDIGEGSIFYFSLPKN